MRLKHCLAGSTVMISQRGTDNYTASSACLGAAEDNRLGLIISSVPDSLFVVASLVSEHVCEYHHQDLIFAFHALAGKAQRLGTVLAQQVD